MIESNFMNTVFDQLVYIPNIQSQKRMRVGEIRTQDSPINMFFTSVCKILTMTVYTVCLVVLIHHPSLLSSSINHLD